MLMPNHLTNSGEKEWVCAEARPTPFVLLVPLLNWV
jgi:hypothetical protein